MYGEEDSSSEQYGLLRGCAQAWELLSPDIRKPFLF